MSPEENGNDQTPERTKRARRLRRNETLSERKLWQALRRKQVLDVRFRRQHPIGPYFADFVCLRAKLVIEVDGPSHLDAAQLAYDEGRTRWLEREGYRILRLWNLDVLTNLDRVVERIAMEVEVRLGDLHVR